MVKLISFIKRKFEFSAAVVCKKNSSSLTFVPINGLVRYYWAKTDLSKCGMVWICVGVYYCQP